MVILAGSGHLAFGSGIPQRLERRTHASYAIVLNAEEGIEPRMADYVLLSEDRTLPPAGVLGVALQDEDGACRVRSLTPGGAAEKGGLKEGDVLIAIDGRKVDAVADVRLALWDKKPGDRVRVAVRRKHLFGAKERTFEVELGASSS
jgi:S1-C subfamily serine protease